MSRGSILRNGNKALTAALDALLGLPSDLFSIVWSVAVFIALAPLVLAVAILARSDCHDALGKWLLDRVRAARGHNSTSTPA